MNNKKGISLIVLVITILVMIILAGVVIVSLQNDNPIERAKYAKMVDSVQSVRGAISQYAVTKQASSADQSGETALDAILTKDKVSTGTYAGWYKLDKEKAKGELGVDPSKITEGEFYVNSSTGASIFHLGSTTFNTLAKDTDGIVQSTVAITTTTEK